MQTVVEPLDRLADALIPKLPRAGTKIWTAQRKSARFWYNTLWDIANFSEELGKVTRDKVVRQAAREARAALQQSTGKFVIAEAHNGPGVSRCGGVTIYLPSVLVGISRYYGDLSFAKDHHWLAMLKAYHA
jgi:hypothetical protein